MASIRPPPTPLRITLRFRRGPHLPPHHLPSQPHPVASPRTLWPTRRGSPLLLGGSFGARAGTSGSAPPGSSASLCGKPSQPDSAHPTTTSPTTTTRLTTCSPTSQRTPSSTPTPSHINQITNNTKIINMVDTHVHCLRRVTPLPISSLIPTRPYNKLQTDPDWPFSSWCPPVWE